MAHFFYSVVSSVVIAAAMTTSVLAQPLEADPRVIKGELANGLTYYIMPHDNPPKRAAVWMHMDTGSLNETDAQRGIAHFLEHMAFNGSKNFPPGTVVKYFESLGLTFGRHQNAFTSFDQTTYQLALPDNSVEKLRQALLFMSDVNGRLLLDPKEIENERQIILEEKTSRKSGRQRIMDTMNSRMAPGSIFGERLPIGIEETIKGMQPKDFQDYYTTFYTPSNAAIVVVADADPAVVASEIGSAFADMTEKKPKPKSHDAGIKAYKESFAVVATDAELSRATVGMLKVAPPHPPTVTIPQLREDYVRTLAMAAFNRRVQDKVSEGKVAFLGAIAYASPYGGAMWQTMAQASGEPAKWRGMLTDLAAEMLRAREFGFSQAEIDEARKDQLASAQQQAQQEPTLPARAHLNRINTALADGRTLRSAAQRLESAEAIMPGITPQECSAWFKEEFDPTNVMFFVNLPSNADVPTEPELLSFAKAAFSAKVEQETQGKRAEKLIEKLPTPGTVTEQSEHAASGVWSGWLSNGVRMHHKFSDYHKNEVTVAVTMLGGELLETPDTRGITSAATQAWSQQATSTLTSTDIRSLMSGKKVGVGGRSGADSVQLSVSGTPDELEFGMQLAHLLLTDPRLEEVAFSRWRTAQLQNLESMEKNPGQMFGKLIGDTVYPKGEVRSKAMTREQVEHLRREDAQAWLNTIIANSPIEVSVVGDLPREKAIELVARYIGSLPTRPRMDPSIYVEKRQLPKEPGPRVTRETMVTQTPTASVFVGFFGPDAKNIADSRAMEMAARVLSSRMVQEVREKEQLVYSISASSTPGETYPGYGMFRAAAPTQPEKADALAAKIVAMYETFGKTGPTEDEMKIAKGQFANTLDEAMKEPGFWLATTATMTLDGMNLDDVVATPSAMQAMTADAVLETFKKYFSPKSLVTVVLKPVAPEAEKPAAEPAGQK